MPPDPKPITRVEPGKRRGSRDAKKPIAPQAPPKVPDLIDDTHVSDLSSLSELDDSEAETEKLEDSPIKGAPKSIFSYTQSLSRPIPVRIPLELKLNKNPDVELNPEEGESQPAKKRKRENGDISQKDVKVEEKTSRPATPLTSKISITSDKNKKSKTAEIAREKQIVIPMEGVEMGTSLVVVNGDEDLTQDDPPESEPQVASEIPAETGLEAEQKDIPPNDADPEVDEETAEGAEVSREDEEGEYQSNFAHRVNS